MIMDDSTIRHLNFKLPSNYRSCFVPMCKNNSKNSPDKVFIVVPRDFKKRKLWFNLARRSDNPTNSHFYCCQDHFILEEDMENYMRFKLFGAPIKIKLNAVPRFFDCHPDRSRAAKPLQRTAYKKLQHAKEMKEILMEEEHSEGQLRLHDEDSENSENIYVRRENECNSYSNCSSNVQSSDENVFHELCLSPAEVLTVKNDENIILPSNSSVTSKNKNKAIQVSTIVKNPRKHFRSVGVQCVAKTACKSTETINDANDALNKTLQAEVRKENILPIKNIEQFNAELNTYSSTSISATTGSEYKVLSGESHDVEGWDENLKINSLNMINYFISRDPKRYIGIPEDWMWIIDHLQVITNISTDDIKLTLMKIRLNDTFVRLSNQFGMSATKASHVFNSSVQKLAVLLKQFIFFPEKKSVIRALSIAFRANFSDVQAIIDAFEIQIEKPSDPVHQSLTWSEYKKCNTLKFLISSSPDGFINFISHGYGGRISDTNLFDVCGIMDSLPEGCAVMADRGFKQIDTILAKKNCKLVRPPSVSSHSKLSKTEAIETKRIASLRIHIERVIRRMREFKLLVPHACLNHSIMSYIDSAVTVAAALVNLQPIIIKT